jgi:hypothetical protein
VIRLTLVGVGCRVEHVIEFEDADHQHKETLAIATRPPQLYMEVIILWSIEIYSRFKLYVVSAMVRYGLVAMVNQDRLSTVWRAVAVVVALRVWLGFPARNDHVVDQSTPPRPALQSVGVGRCARLCANVESYIFECECDIKRGHCCSYYRHCRDRS